MKPKPVRPEDWRSSDDYLYALDLCNFGYWWECHEVLEGLWHAVGTKTEQGSFFQALVDLAAGNLKQSTGEHESATKLWSYALTRLERLPSPYMGLDLRGLESEIRSRLADPSLPPIVLRLHF